MAAASNSITTKNRLVGNLSSDNVVAGTVNTAFNPAYALVTEAGNKIILHINSDDYKMYAELLNKNDETINVSNIIDLPIESMVVDGRYDSTTKKLILVLDNGNEIEVPLGALINGLVSTEELAETLTDYVKFTDYASAVKSGVIKTSDSYATTTASGVLTSQTKTYTDYDNLDNNAFVSKGTLENVIEGKELIDSSDIEKYDEDLFGDAIVSSEGTEITLSNTIETTIEKIELSASELEQETTTGKNKLNSLGTYSAGTTRTSNGVNYTFNEDGSITINGTATGTSFALLIGESLNDYQTEKFRITEDYVAGSWSNANVQLITRGTDGEYRTIYKGNNTDIVNIKNIPIGVIFVQVVTNATVNETIYPQIELGNTQTSYEKFTGGNPAPNPDYPQDVHVVSGNNEITIANSDNSESQTYPINLGTIELCKIGDYQDYIYKDNGKWYKHSEIGKVVLDGSETWTYSTSNVVFYSDVIRELAMPRTIYYCNRFFRVDITTTYANMKNGETKYDSANVCRLITKMTNYTTSNDFKNWLSNNNTSVYYVLATPTNTEITDQTLITQLDNFEKAKSYNNQTNISQENNDLPFIISATALMKNSD